MRDPHVAPPFTAADYRVMPDDGKHHQLVEGGLFMAPAPNTFHQFIQKNVLVSLEHYLREHPVGIVLGAPCDVYVDDLNVFQPDVLYIANAHLDRIRDDGIHGPPDLVVEILSPTTAGLDRRKRAILARAGTVEFWQIDPALRQIQRFVFAENPAKPVGLIDEPETFNSALFPGLKVETTEIFRR